MDERAERAILSHAEAYRLVEEARQMREERDALAAIVRELAERGPFIDSALDCATCGYDPFAMGEMGYPANHAPDCLWRRAKALYP
jgi:hypothetical protein